MFHGLTKLKVKQLAYKFATAKQKKIPVSWISNQLAGEDWLKGFRHRNRTLSLRQPEATSLARACAFNKHNVGYFFDNLQNIFNENNIPPQNIFNLDETGLSTVQKPSQVFALAGSKQVGKVTSAERGENVTMCACINAIGNALPPAFIFPRVYFKEHMLSGAPNGSLGLSCSSGWMNSDLFPQVLRHFIHHMKISKESPGLLLLDNHHSHIGLEVINIAEANGLHILTFPPHCSHRLQPLDVCVFGPFKRFYSSFCDGWMTSHAGQSIIIYSVAKMADMAFAKAFNPENITSSFKNTGIFPYNRNVFTEDEFLPAAVTDIALATENADNQQAIVVSNQPHDQDILTAFMAQPKTTATTRKKSRQQKSSIITSPAEKKKRFPEACKSSSESEDEVLLSSTDESADVESSSEDKKNDPFANVVPPMVAVCSFVVMKVSNIDKSKNFVVQVISGPDEENDYEVTFMKSSSKVKNAFVFPEHEDLASCSHNDFVCTLSSPSPVAQTSRLSNIFKFQENLALFSI